MCIRDSLWNVRKQLVFWSRFMVFPTCGCYLGHDFIILGVQNLSFDRPGASIFVPWGPFCQLGDTREDHGRTHGGPGPDFQWFRLILGPLFESFLGSDGLKSLFFLELVSRQLFASIFWWNYWQLELLKQGFRTECIAKTMLSQKPFINDSRLVFCVFWRP